MLGRTQEAEQALRQSVAVVQKLIDVHPDVEPHRLELSERYYELGLLLHDSRRSDESAEAFRAAMKLFEAGAKDFPDDPRRQFALAWPLSTCPAPQFRDPVRAVAAAQRALQLVPSKTKYWKVLGIAQYRAGNSQAAVEALNRAMELDQVSDNSPKMFFLAMAHWQLGHRDEARKWYDKAVEWMDKNDPKNEELLRFRAEAAKLLDISESQSSTDKQDPTSNNGQPPAND